MNCPEFLCLPSFLSLRDFLLRSNPAQRQSNPRPTSKTSSPFLEAETLLRQGSVAEAKQKIQEQLTLDPSSVEGYNLLGIVYSSEKDYDNALKHFSMR